MKKLGKTIGSVCGILLVAGLIPYHFGVEENGSFEIDALLWSVKKTPGKEKDTYTVEFLPLVGTAEDADGGVGTVDE